MNANGREYPVAVDEYAWAILQRIECVRFREFPYYYPSLPCLFNKFVFKSIHKLYPQDNLQSKIERFFFVTFRDQQKER